MVTLPTNFQSRDRVCAPAASSPVLKVNMNKIVIGQCRLNHQSHAEYGKIAIMLKISNIENTKRLPGKY